MYQVFVIRLNFLSGQKYQNLILLAKPDKKKTYDCNIILVIKHIIRPPYGAQRLSIYTTKPKWASYSKIYVLKRPFGVVVYNPGLEAHQKIVTLVGSCFPSVLCQFQTKIELSRLWYIYDLSSLLNSFLNPMIWFYEKKSSR